MTSQIVLVTTVQDACVAFAFTVVWLRGWPAAARGIRRKDGSLAKGGGGGEMTNGLSLSDKLQRQRGVRLLRGW
jgi:hypothetical protein